MGSLKDPKEGLEKFIAKFNKALDCIKLTLQKIKNNKKFNQTKLAKIGIGSLLAVSIIAIGYKGYTDQENRLRAYNVYLDQDFLGIVRDQEEIPVIMERLQNELTSTYNVDIVLHGEISFEETKATDDLLSEEKDLEKNFKRKIDFTVNAYVLMVDGVEVGALKTRQEFEEIIDRIEMPYIELMEDNEVKDVSIVEKVEIVKKEMALSQIGDKEEIYEYLITSTEEVRTHTVEVGESLWTISKIYGLELDDLIEANMEINPDRLQIGDIVKLVVPKPVLTVATTREVEYIEKIKFESETEYDDGMYKTDRKTKVKGESGEKLVTANEIKHNGILYEKEVLMEEVVKDPVTEVIIKGTKEPPKTVALGIFQMPTRGTITSRYGMRSGRMHYGLDIGAKTGTQIKAADGGKVTYAGYNGAFGNLVEIDHGNGYKTKYAHCSAIHVKVGDKVFAGQHIADVGNTGRSTGPHLHFEVILNGKNQNPANYVK